MLPKWITDNFIVINTDKKPSVDDIRRQLIENSKDYDELRFSDEYCFLKHLQRKYKNGE